MRREVGGVDRDPVRVEPVEVLADRAPAPVEPGRVLVPARELPAQLLEHLVGDRGVAEAVLAEHVERHALVHLRLVGRIDEQLQVGVRVHVDEAGADEEPVRVDHALRGLVDATDVRDPAARDADVGAVPGIAGAVDHAAAADQHVEQRSGLVVGREVRDELARHLRVAGEQAAVDAQHVAGDPRRVV